PATRFAVAPAARKTRFAVKTTDPLVPAVVWIVEFPERKTTPGTVAGSPVPSASVEATPLPPRKLRVPPLNATTAVSLMRLVLLTPVLSKVSVPPALIVTAALPGVVVETLPSTILADAVRPDVLMVMSG